MRSTSARTMARWKRGLIWVFAWQLYLSFSSRQHIWYSGYTPEDCTNKRRVMLLLNSDIGTSHFIVIWRHCTFYKLKVCGSPTPVNLSASFVQQHFSNLCLCVNFSNLCGISKFFIIITLVMVICGQWSLMLLLQLAEA